MKSLQRTIVLTIAFTVSLAAQGTFAVIFDDDPSSTVYRDASFGFVNNGDYLKLTNNDKLPLDASRRYSGTMCGVLEYNHVSNGNWEMFIASNGWQTRDFSGYDSLVFYVNGPVAIPGGELPKIGLEEATSNAKTPLIAIATYVTLDGDTNTWQRVAIPFRAFEPFGGFSLASFKTVRFAASGVTSATRTLWIDLIAAVRIGGGPSTPPPLSTERLLDTLQYTAFRFFWNEANPANGLIKDRSNANGGGSAPSSIASVGFGLTAICIGVDHGWVTRAAARDRVLTTLRTFWLGPQGNGATGYAGYKGFFFHFLDMVTALRTWDSELSSIDTALLLAGILYVREYFDGADTAETEIRSLADSIYFRVDWKWFRNYNPGLLLGWMPGTGFSGYGQWTGYNEAMIMYILGYGSPTHPISDDFGWLQWTSGYTVGTYYGYTYVLFPPLFGHQYSHCWVDFRNIRDAKMRSLGWDYFENSRRATLAQRAYCAANPGGWTGYSDSLWGITASDSPTGYSARGAPPAQNDDGTLVPTAPISSLPFAPEVVIPAIHALWNNYRPQLWTQYGFRDAFNLNVNWWGPDVIGIDQGPIIIMIENYRTGKVWQTFMKNPYIQNALMKIGFAAVVSVEEKRPLPLSFSLKQNFPNPFNPTTTIQFSLPHQSHVKLEILDLLGRHVATLVHGIKEAGFHTVQWTAGTFPSGVYFYRLQAAHHNELKRMLLLR